MSIQTRNPLRMLGGVQESGTPQTGEQQTTQGGSRTYLAASGLGAATLVYSGVAGQMGGRLNTIQVLNQIQSGRGVYFVDAHAVSSGMPLVGSGHKVLGFIPDYQLVGGGSGTVILNPAAYAGAIQEPMAPFFSGLVACPVASGGPGFALTYTPEFVPQSGPQQLV